MEIRSRFSAVKTKIAARISSVHISKKVALFGLGFVVIVGIAAVATYILINRQQPTQSAEAPKPITIALGTPITIHGSVDKGPFKADGDIAYRELDSALNPTAEAVKVAKTNANGEYNFSYNFKSSYLLLSATGQYYNEVNNVTSATPITLYVVVALGDSQQVDANINVVTTLSIERAAELMHTAKMSFADGYKQAQHELLKTFEIDTTSDFTKVNYLSAEPESSMLIAVSSIVQHYMLPDELTSMMTMLSADLKDNGQLDTYEVLGEISRSITEVDPIYIRSNLEKYYAALSIKQPVPAFEKYLKKRLPMQIVSSVPLTGASQVDPHTGLAICLNQIPDPASVNNSNIKVLDDNDSVLATNAVPDPTSKCFGIDGAQFKPARKYRVVLKDVASPTGNKLEDTTINFSTGVSNLEGLIEYNTFNGNGNDSSGNANLAEVVGGSYRDDRHGNANSAVRLATKDDWILFPMSLSLSKSDWTVSLWFGLDSFSTEDMILFGYVDNLNVSYYISVNAGTHQVGTVATDKFYPGPTVEVGKWHHVAWTKEGENLKLYLDGELIGSNKVLGSYTTSATNYYASFPFTDSARPDLHKFYGSYDDLKVYNRVLNGSEVKQLASE